MDEDELDRVRERVESSLTAQYAEHGDDEEHWTDATVPDTTVKELVAEVERLRLVERLTDVLHWGVDAVWSCMPDPSVWPDLLDPLWSYAHSVVSHEETPDPRRIEELRELVDRAYDNQRPGLSLEDQQRRIDVDGAGKRRPEPLTQDELDDLLGLGHDAWSAEYPMPEADQRRLGELAARAWQLLPDPGGQSRK